MKENNKNFFLKNLILTESLHYYSGLSLSTWGQRFTLATMSTTYRLFSWETKRKMLLNLQW